MSVSCTSVWSCSIDPDVLFSLVNYCRVITVRSVTKACINRRKRFPVLAHRTLEPELGLPAAYYNSGLGSRASQVQSLSPGLPSCHCFAGKCLPGRASLTKEVIGLWKPGPFKC